MTHPETGSEETVVDAADVDDDERIVQQLASDPSRVKAAKALGISTRTIRRRLEDPNFRRRVSDARKDLQAESWARTLGLRDKAASVFEDALESGDERIRLQAARYVFEISGRNRREQLLEEMDARMDDLDERIAQSAEDGR